MFLSVLTENLNWESLTKSLVSLKNLIFFREGWAVFRIKAEGGWKKKEEVFCLPHFGRWCML